MTKLLNRYTTTLPLLSLVALALALSGGSRATYAHHLCGTTGSPYGAFDLQTYEAADYRNVYARTMELAGINQLFPELPTFSLPAVEGVQQDPYIPPVLLKSIAWLESGWSQASYDPLVRYGEIGPVLSSHDCGYGIMQITSGMQNVSGVPNLDQAMIGGHYAFNIARGARILADKWNLAPEYRPFVGSRNSALIEDWYYALWAYNGFAFKNHPLNPALDPNREPYRCDGTQPRSAYPYQELVLGCVASPPWRGGAPLWPAQSVSLPNINDPTFRQPLDPANWDACATYLQCSAMNIPTPNPWHTDPPSLPPPREQVIGVPAISVSTGGIALTAVPGGQSLGMDFTISNSGSGVLAWRASSGASWLKLSRLQGVALGADLGSIAQTLRVYADAAGLPPGNYNSQLTLESLYASGAPVTVPVTLQVDLKAGTTISTDFTGDGMSDIIFLCCSDYASLWLSQGGDNFSVRTFRPWPGYNMQAGTRQAGDFNRDGRTDLAHLCCEDYGNIWLSNGDGTFRVQPFRPGPGYGLQSGTWRTGDFNADGRTDLLHLCCGDYVNVWLSNGDGTFTVAAFSPWPGYGVQSGSWQTADVNGDGKTDAVHLCCDDYANTWLSNGDGTFAVSSFRPWPGYGIQSGSWVAGNFNGDHSADLIHFWGGGPANIWLSNGNGNFSIVPFEPWPGYDYLSGVWLPGDFNGDGRTDLAHIWGGGSANVWLSRDDPGFSVNPFSPWPGYGFRSGSWYVGDFDGNGRTDLFHLCCDYVNVWRSDGTGSFVVHAFVP